MGQTQNDRRVHSPEEICLVYIHRNHLPKLVDCDGVHRCVQQC